MCGALPSRWFRTGTLKGQTDEAMAVHIRLARMAGMVMQQGNGIELLAKFGCRRVIDTEEERLIL